MVMKVFEANTLLAAAKQRAGEYKNCAVRWST